MNIITSVYLPLFVGTVIALLLDFSGLLLGFVWGFSYVVYFRFIAYERQVSVGICFIIGSILLALSGAMALMLEASLQDLVHYNLPRQVVWVFPASIGLLVYSCVTLLVEKFN